MLNTCAKYVPLYRLDSHGKLLPPLAEYPHTLVIDGTGLCFSTLRQQQRDQRRIERFGVLIDPESVGQPVNRLFGLPLLLQ